MSRTVVRDQLNAALKTATDSQDQRTIAIVRLIDTALAERDQQARDDGHPSPIPDHEVLAMLQAMAAQRCESTRRYEESGQLELAQREAEEVQVIRRFLPAQLDDAACSDAINQVCAELGASKLKDIGRVMVELKNRYPGRMDFVKARRQLCEQLG
jgi:hypothetical protein